MLKSSIIRLATLQAQQVELSKYRTIFRLGAVLFDKNIILNTGRNYPSKSHPKSNSTHKFQHAEFNTLLGVPQHLMKGASLFVLRLAANDALTLAAPCPSCRFLINQAKIKHLYYTNEKAEIQYERMY